MTSRFDRLSLRNKVIAIAILVSVPSFLFSTQVAAQTDTKPLVLEIKNIPNIPDVHTINNFTNPPVNQTDLLQIDPLQQNTAILQDYLSQKGSPLAPYASEILQNENWKLVLAISNGESTMCKRQMYNNCWGVGGAWNLRRYKSFSEGFADVDRLLGEKYIPTGRDTPTEIVRKYVGNYSPTWVRAVNQTLDQLNQLALVNWNILKTKAPQLRGF